MTPPPSLPRNLDLERDVITALKRDGALDALRAKTIEQIANDERMKTFTEFAVRGSSTLRSERARAASRVELIEALYRECEGSVLEEARTRTWEALTTTAEGVGREVYERAFERAAKERERGGS